MANLTGFAITGVIGIGLGAVGYWAYQVIEHPEHRNPRVVGVNGDPPVTVSDGSLHGHSRLWGWESDTDGDLTVYASPSDGKLKTNCGLVSEDNPNGQLSAMLWTDDGHSYDLTPSSAATVVTINYDQNGTASGNASDAVVTITIPTTGPPSMTSAKDGFWPAEVPKATKDTTKKSKRRHHRGGEISSMSVTHNGSAVSLNNWTPGKNPHFTIAICYREK